MTFAAKVGSFARPTTPGNQAITGLGFQPKVVLFFASPLTADGSGAAAFQHFGVGISSSDRRSILMRYKDAVATNPNNFNDQQNAICISMVSATSDTIAAEANFVSQDSDGFTLNWVTANATAGLVNYLALGGSDISDVKGGAFTVATVTGNQAVTGLGFQPDWVIFYQAGLSTTSTVRTSTNSIFHLGFATASNVSATSVRSKDAATAVERSVQKTDKCISCASDSGVFCEASLVSLDSDGFTINWSTAHSAAAYMSYVAGKGGQIKAGALNQPSSTGNQSVTGAGFQPSAALFVSANKTTSGSNTENARLTLGAATSSSERFSAWSGGTDAQTTSVADHWLKRDKAIVLATEGTPSLAAEADFVSNDSDGFTINWTTADATAREVRYLLFGAAASAGAELAGGATGQATAAGSLDTDIPLAGAAAGVASAVGALAGDTALVGAAAGVASAVGVLAITIRADYERASCKLADSSVSGSGDSAIITIKPRFQSSEITSGEVRWLEPSARIDGVGGFRPTFRFSSYYTSGTGAYHGQPWASTRRPMFSYDRETWTYFDTAVTVDGTNHWIEFRHSTAFTGDTVYISRSRQMSVEQVGAWIDSLAAAHPTIIEPTPSAAAFTPTLTSWSGQDYIADEFSAQTNELSEAIPATPLYAFRINDTSLMPAGGVAKRLAVVTAGVHAGEDHGNHVLKAFVDAVLGASAWGENLRRNYLIDIYPLINPPGRAGGGWRGSFTLGAGSIDDANRHFSDATPGLEIVTKPRTAITTDCGGAKPDWAVDFHGHFSYPWGIYAEPTFSLHSTFMTRLASYSGHTLTDEGDNISGTVEDYFRNTLGCTFSVTHETGDPSMISDASIATHADALVRTLDSMFVQLVGAATAAASASGSLAGGAAQLAGAGQDQAFAVADLTTAIQLASAAIAVPGASGTLIAGIPLDGAALSVSGAAAALTAQIRLDGAALGQAAAAAGFYDQAALQGAAAGSAAGTATLTVDILLHGTGAAAAAGPATLTTRIDLSAAALAQATAQGYLVQDIPLFGVALATAGATGALASGPGALWMKTRAQRLTHFALETRRAN